MPLQTNYKVLVEFEYDGVMQVIDAVIELPEEVAAPLVEAGQLEAVTPEEGSSEEGSSETGASSEGEGEGAEGAGDPPASDDPPAGEESSSEEGEAGAEGEEKKPWAGNHTPGKKTE